MCAPKKSPFRCRERPTYSLRSDTASTVGCPCTAASRSSEQWRPKGSRTFWSRESRHGHGTPRFKTCKSTPRGPNNSVPAYCVIGVFHLVDRTPSSPSPERRSVIARAYRLQRFAIWKLNIEFWAAIARRVLAIARARRTSRRSPSA